MTVAAIRNSSASARPLLLEGPLRGQCPVLDLVADAGVEVSRRKREGERR